MKLPWTKTNNPDDAQLKERLTREQYRVTQKSGTERAFSGEYHATKDAGTYRCIVCDTELFDSTTKFDSGTGWPSFFNEISDGAVERVTDRSLGMARIEARCATCQAHLGHVFNDGPAPTGERYCMNSASLRLERTGNADAEKDIGENAGSLGDKNRSGQGRA